MQQGKPGGWVGGKPPVGDAWRRHHPWPGGPVFVPTGAYYSYGGDYYYDETDVNHCWVYRKVYDRAGHFLGWAHVELVRRPVGRPEGGRAQPALRPSPPGGRASAMSDSTTA